MKARITNDVRRMLAMKPRARVTREQVEYVIRGGEYTGEGRNEDSVRRTADAILALYGEAS